MLVYEQSGGYAQYTGRGREPVAIYDRERAVIESARRLALARGLDQIRVVFIIEQNPESDAKTRPYDPPGRAAAKIQA